MSTPDQRVSMDERLRTNYDWTPRQRQVLDLLAAGRSNPEIADRRGSSRDGAKYHISEVLNEQVDAAIAEGGWMFASVDATVFPFQ